MTDVGSFWARRRAAVKAEEEAEERAVARAERLEAVEGKEDSEVLADLGLPDPETMQAGDDFSGFMSEDVPEHLRKMALRKLWRSNPVLACVDGLNEYDDDYRAAMLLSEPVKTAYQVGKGMKAHLDEMARKAEEAEELERDEGEDVSESVAVADAVEPVGTPVTAPSLVTNVPDAVEAEVADENLAESDLPAPRRMRFHFQEATI